MLGATYTDLRRGVALVQALQSREITVREFEDAASCFQPEAAQVLATVISQYPGLTEQMHAARLVCARSAARGRRLS